MADSGSTRRERRAAARAERHERERADAARARQRRRLFQLGGALALAAAIVVVIVLATGGGDDRGGLRAGESVVGSRDAIALFAGIPQDGTALGDPRAPVTLVEFADLQCPFCRDFTMQVLPMIVSDYVASGRVRLEFRPLSFIGTDSTRAAQMAVAVGQQDKLYQFLDIFYANQGEENAGYVTDEFLRRIAGAIPGVNVDRAMGSRGTEDVLRVIDNAEQQAQAHAISATPSFLIGASGGTLRPLNNQTLDPQEFSEKLDQALQRAR